MITAEASLSDEWLEPLLHYLFGIPQGLLDAYHLSGAHRMVRVDKPVLLLDLHPRLIVNLVDHHLQVIIFLFLDHIQQLGCLDLDGLRHGLPLGHNGSELGLHRCVMLLPLCKLDLRSLSLLCKEFFCADLVVIGRGLVLLLELRLQPISLGDVLGVPHSLIGDILIWLHKILDYMWVRHADLS